MPIAFEPPPTHAMTRDGSRPSRSSALGQHAATLTFGKPGVLHGSMSYVLQDDDGQTADVHSCSAGLDYPGVGPEHAYWKDTGRVEYVSIDDADVLVAAPREVDEQMLVAFHRRRQLHRVGDGVARLERRDDALGAAEAVERRQRLVVGDADVLGPADVVQPGVLGADAGVVEAGRDRVRLVDLAVLVGQHIGA